MATGRGFRLPAGDTAPRGAESEEMEMGEHPFGPAADNSPGGMFSAFCNTPSMEFADWSRIQPAVAAMGKTLFDKLKGAMLLDLEFWYAPGIGMKTNYGRDFMAALVAWAQADPDRYRQMQARAAELDAEEAAA